MKIISFAWTTPALLAGVKTVTRRECTDRYARSFRAGELAQAWNKLPRTSSNRSDKPIQKVAQRVGTIQLTREPYQEQFEDTPFSEWWAEGLAYMDRLGYPEARAIWDGWKRDNPLLWVVRFNLVVPRITQHHE